MKWGALMLFSSCPPPPALGLCLSACFSPPSVVPYTRRYCSLNKYLCFKYLNLSLHILPVNFVPGNWPLTWPAISSHSLFFLKARESNLSLCKGVFKNVTRMAKIYLGSGGCTLFDPEMARFWTLLTPIQ